MASTSSRTNTLRAKNPKASHEHGRNIPLPVILSNSCVIAEKYDDYLRKLSKTHPSTMRNLEEEKKRIQEKKNVLSTLIEKIKLDIKEMRVATMQLDILYGNERQMEAEKQIEMLELETLLRVARERKCILFKNISKFSSAMNFMDTLAASNEFQNVRHLVEYYLTLEALNEQFLEIELHSMDETKEMDDRNVELHNLFKEHLHEAMKREQSFEVLQKQRQEAEHTNSRLQSLLSDSVNRQLEDHENWELTKRWTSEMCKKISHYKEISSKVKDFSRQLEEVQEFILTLKKIIKRL